MDASGAAKSTGCEFMGFLWAAQEDFSRPEQARAHSILAQHHRLDKLWYSNSKYDACTQRRQIGICRLNLKSRLSDWESTPVGVFHLEPGGL